MVIKGEKVNEGDKIGGKERLEVREMSVGRVGEMRVRVVQIRVELDCEFK